MSVSIGQVRCACSYCVRVVSVEGWVRQDGRIYCGDTYADHHNTGAGCQHAGCTGHG